MKLKGKIKMSKKQWENMKRIYIYIYISKINTHTHTHTLAHNI
jgi:hypothetical protein